MEDHFRTFGIVLAAVLGTLTFMAGGFVIALVLGGVIAGAYLHRQFTQSNSTEENENG